ncbi:hypothetical protein FACS1894162_6470 [Bacteroidia bacterium]|nr:hypothetical protein FACS1894162_6470 [Bacteroidia bacterium]
MRYYLDTNILAFILTQSQDDIHYHTSNLLSDYANSFYASSIAIQELMLLYRIGKVNIEYKSDEMILKKIRDANIETVFFNKYHLESYSRLQILEGHKDMNDHAIIAQAISDKIPLISSDHAFKYYTPQGLNFIFNKR